MKPTSKPLSLRISKNSRVYLYDYPPTNLLHSAPMILQFHLWECIRLSSAMSLLSWKC